MKLFKKAQGATEYLLMLAAVLVIVAVAVYYVTRTGGYPTVAATAAENNSHARINVESGSIVTGEWQYIVSATTGSTTWTDGTEPLDAPYVSLGDPGATGKYYVSLRHKTSGHIYFSDSPIDITE